MGQSLLIRRELKERAIILASIEDRDRTSQRVNQ
jgi:hypothetical protein